MFDSESKEQRNENGRQIGVEYSYWTRFCMQYFRITEENLASRSVITYVVRKKSPNK